MSFKNLARRFFTQRAGLFCARSATARAPACLCARPAPACLCARPAPACLRARLARIGSAPACLCARPAPACLRARLARIGSAPACLCARPAPACLRARPAPACLRARLARIGSAPADFCARPAPAAPAFAFYLSLLLALPACSHFIKKQPADGEAVGPSVKISHFDSASYTSVPADGYKSPLGDISLDDHPSVDKWIAYFTGPGRELMRTYLERSSRYLPMMKNVLRENQLPESLVYAALIESGFSPTARSRANAVGYWQFIAGTARHYGLKINRFVDERRDPVLSTRAAAEYFKKLYALFEDWHLALASYNAGEYRVNRAVLRNYSRNFWRLAEKRALPSETRNYVPKFIAAARIASDPEKYGFFHLNQWPPLQYETTALSRPISLKKQAKEMNLPYEELRALNPAYKGEYAPVYAKDMYLRIPSGMKEQARLAAAKSGMKEPKSGYYDFYWYRVRRGDSLYKIARRNRITLAGLKRENGIRRGSLIRVGQRLKIPASGTRSRRGGKARVKAAARNPSAVHIVRRGESLSRIARKRKISVADLRRANNLKGKIIHPGQRLKLSSGGKAATTSGGKAQNPLNNRRHIVKQGDTLIGIAKKHRVRLVDLLNANSLDLNSVIFEGARLTIPN